MPEPPLRIAFVVPAYWPAEGFGGPVWVLRSLARELVALGHSVDVWTTTLEQVGHRAGRRTHIATLDGATVSYIGTPLRYRWMGFAPTLRRHLRRAPRPDVAHIFGFRDPIGFDAAHWFRKQGVPYVFEALGMFRPKLRKRLLKRFLDSTLLASLPRGAAIVVAASQVERGEYLDAGIPPERIAVRPNGIPVVPREPSHRLRDRIGIGDEPLILYVGRVADGKGLDFLVDAVSELARVHLAIVGPDDGHGTTRRLTEQARRKRVEQRIHMLGRWETQPLEVYADADVFALPSAHENFGMAAAEAASAGIAVVVTDRCGVADLLRDNGALVVAYDAASVREALATLLADPGLRRRIGDLGAARAAEYRWPPIAALQESIYRRALA